MGNWPTVEEYYEQHYLPSYYKKSLEYRLRKLKRGMMNSEPAVPYSRIRGRNTFPSLPPPPSNATRRRLEERIK